MQTKVATPPAAATNLPWPQLSDFIARRLGLHFPPERHLDLQRGLAGAAKEFEFEDTAAFAEWLLRTPLDRRQLQMLAGHLTIGETYFFRDKKTLEALSGHVLPELLQRHARDKHLRIWSAACCTGEEPYSLAILLRQCIPDIQHWRISILATDINERFLQKAVAGIYGEWSFRDPPPGLKENYFTRTPDGRYALLPQIKQMVRFVPLNLAEDAFPSLTTDTQAMDLIFCRNALMYFTPAQAGKVVQNLRRALLEEGWLVASASESSNALFAGFETVNFPGAILYRKKNDRSLTEDKKPVAWEPPLPSPPSFVPPPAPPPPQDYSSLARSLANEGNLEAALACCDRWIATDAVDPAARYLRAVILEELGNPQEARRSLQQAIYLHPDFVLAHFALGNLARSAGKTAETRKHFTTALQLLHDCAPDDVLPEADGLTAGRLAEIVTSLLAFETAA